MSLPFRRRSRPRGAAGLALAGDIPATSEADTEQWLSQIRPADYDGSTVIFTGASEPGQPDPAPRAEPTARYQPAPAAFPALHDTPPRDTGPLQRLPRIARVAQRPRPQRPADAAIFTWSTLISQHIMLCGTCPPRRRSRHADPTAATMPFTFEALRDSAYDAGWRLDAFGRWACKACQDTPAYWSPRPVTHFHPEVGRRRHAGQDVPPHAEATAIAIVEHGLLRDVTRAAAKHARSVTR
jgi:hypothetical protein